MPKAADLVAEFRGDKTKFDRTEAAVDRSIARLSAVDPEIGFDLNDVQVRLGIQRIETMLASVADENVDIDVRTAAAFTELARLAGQTEAVGALDPDIDVDADVTVAVANLGRVASVSESLAAMAPNVNVTADTAVATSQLGQVSAAAQALDSQPVNVDVDAETSGAVANIAALRAGLLSLPAVSAAAGSGIAVGLAGGALAIGAAAAAVGVGLGAIGVSSVRLAADFTTTMNTMAAVAQVPQDDIALLRDLAIDMGAKTVFSANEAGAAMLELAKGGIAAAEIEAGALASTLDLATAGDLALAEAATVASTAMNVFSLSGRDSQQVADALAGAANTSSADVGDLAQALAQGGQAAAAAGLNVQETTAALALFADQGLRGSDAGTSLKTALLNLVPTSEKAAGLMSELGLSFVDAEGNITDLIGIQAELQSSLGGLTQAEQIAHLQVLFGTDAYRAMNVLLHSSQAELQGYIAGTSEAGAASAVAAAKMEGLPGALERLSGAWETARLRIGEALAPAVSTVADQLSGAIDGIADKVAPAMNGIIQAISPAIGPVIDLFASLVVTMTPILAVVAQVAGALATSLAPVIAGMAPVISEIAVQFGEFLMALVPLLPALLQLVAAALPLVAALLPVATTIVEFLVPALTTLMGWLEPFMPLIAGLVGAFMAIGPVVVAVGSAFLTVVGFLNPVTLAIGALIGIGVALWQNWDTIKNNAVVVWNLVKDIIAVAVAWIGDRFAQAQQFIATLIFKFFEFRARVGEVIEGAKQFIAGLIGKFFEFRDNVGNAIAGALEFVRSIPGRIRDAIGNIGGMLVGAGRDLIEGLIRGVQQVAGRIAETVLAPIRNAVSGVKNFLGLRSPSKLFAGFGVNIGEGLANGIMAGSRSVVSAADSLARAAVPSFAAAGAPTAQMARTYASSSTASNSGGGGDTYVIHVAGSVVTERDLETTMRRIATGRDQRSGR